jgi:hypothetical protein
MLKGDYYVSCQGKVNLVFYNLSYYIQLDNVPLFGQRDLKLLHKEFSRDELLREMKVLNLIHEFKLSYMKDADIIKSYSNTLLSIANKV